MRSSIMIKGLKLLKFSTSVSVMALLGMSISGCASIEVPPSPERQDQSQFIEAAPKQFFNANGESLPLASEWWTSFNDPLLTQLVEASLVENRQLEVAQSNIQIAQSQLSRERLEKSYSTDSTAGANLGRPSAPNQNVRGTTFGGLGASWEYDAFGRIASTIEAAELNVEAAKQARRDVAVIVSSETALAYVDLRGAQRRLQVARENAIAQKQTLDLLNTLFENGQATALDLNRADSQFQSTLAVQPTLQAIIDGALSRLSVLTGVSASQPSGNIVDLRTTKGLIPHLSSEITLGSPEELIRRRPDIREAETNIARQLALGKVERSRLFPIITFNADISSLFGNSNRLDQLSSFGFGIGPAISWEGPDLRRVRADIDITDAQTQRAYVVYEQTVLQALSDIEVALANLINERKREMLLVRAVDTSREALELAQLRFDEGVDDFLDVLDAQRTLLGAEDSLALNELQTTRLEILTYRELGGI